MRHAVADTPASPPLNGWLLAAAALALLGGGYFTAFLVTGQMSPGESFYASLRNATPAVLLGMALHSLLERTVWPHGHALRWLALIPLGFLFAFGWYLSILVLIGARDGWIDEGFSVDPFTGPGFVWQMFQGITLFALAAAISRAVYLQTLLATRTAASEAGQASHDQPLLVRKDGEIVALDKDEIVLLSGAGDYVEVFTRTDRFLSNGTLIEFESRLGETQFARAHRSHIVRFDAIERAEPAGNGCLSLHLSNGMTIKTSRAGARLVRENSL